MAKTKRVVKSHAKRFDLDIITAPEVFDILMMLPPSPKATELQQDYEFALCDYCSGQYSLKETLSFNSIINRYNVLKTEDNPIIQRPSVNKPDAIKYCCGKPMVATLSSITCHHCGLFEQLCDTSLQWHSKSQFSYKISKTFEKKIMLLNCCEKYVPSSQLIADIKREHYANSLHGDRYITIKQIRNILITLKKESLFNHIVKIKAAVSGITQPQINHSERLKIIALFRKLATHAKRLNIVSISHIYFLRRVIEDTLVFGERKSRILANIHLQTPIVIAKNEKMFNKLQAFQN
jgi:hypothetical protein